MSRSTVAERNAFVNSSSWLVTGATGSIGKVIIRKLYEVAPELEIMCAGRSSGCSVNLDLFSSSIVIPEGVDTVLHLAGEKRNESLMWEVNYEGTRKLVEAAARAGVRRFVYLSSVGVYGARPNSGLVNESFPHTPRNHYEASKDAGERCVREICAGAGMDGIILQPSNVVGIMPGQPRPLLSLMKMIRRGYFTWFGHTDPWVNYVAAEDVAAAVLAAAMRASAGRDYIINTPVQLSRLVGWIAEELDVPVPCRRLPLWVGEAAATLGSVTTRVLGLNLPINQERFTELTNTTQYDSTQLLKDLSFEYPVGVEALIRDLARSYRQDGLL